MLNVKTSYFRDFQIAEHFGKNAILRTYKDALNYCRDYKLLTELEFILNALCWTAYDRKRNGLTNLYAELFYKTQDIFYELYGDDDEAVEYHFETLD